MWKVAVAVSEVSVGLGFPQGDHTSMRVTWLAEELRHFGNKGKQVPHILQSNPSFTL